MRARSRRPSSSAGRPHRRTEPRCGSSPAIACTSVVLPAPFGPITQTHAPAATSRRTSVTIGRPPSSTESSRISRARDTSSAVDRDLALRPHAAARPLRRRIATKNGAPMNAVITPIGISAGDTTVRASRSTRIRNDAPNSTESGSTDR